MDDRKTHSPGVQLLWATATGLVVSVVGIGYSALYTPEMGRRAADAIDSAEAAGTAAATASPASDISVSVSVPPDIAFTGGVESARTAETIATAIHDRRRDPAVSMAASPPTRSVVTASVSAVEERSAPIPVTVPSASALADAQGRDPKLPDSTSIFLLSSGMPPEATAGRPATNDNAPLTGASDGDQLDSRETRSARGISADASGNQSGGSGQSSNSATGPGGTAASGGSTSNSSGATSSGSGANTGTGSGQSNSGTSGGTQSAGNQGAGAQGGTAGAAGNAASGAANAVSGAANAVGGTARGALGAVDHAAGGALGGGGGGLGKP